MDKDMACERFSPPSILRSVLGDESDVLDLLIIAVHETFLKSGLVGFDSVSGTRVNGLQFPEEWPSSATPLSVSYTLPEVLDKEDVSESIVLNIRRVINGCVVVSGSLTESRSKLYLTLDQNRFAPVLDLLRRNCLDEDKMREVYDLWKTVKDQLVLPLSIQLSEKTGATLPPCFMRLSSYLKRKILELLPATDVARMACVSSEMQILCSNGDLWKQRYAEEFGYASETKSCGNWKNRFGWDWKIKKNNYKKKETRSESYLQDFFDSRGSFTSQFRPSLLALNTYYKEKEISPSSNKCKFLDMDVFCC
ncbi:unnamed protein product [Dovyalis caffra]|uniref:F-box domain-containing protein n=1 Tax=Dovyalis caffra TaxID=77055 RepID=A0AAV1RSU3_9ROSI|nr:unnamed protein product [Dovyalis caffra]